MKKNRENPNVFFITLCLVLLVLCPGIHPSRGDREEALSAYENADDTIKIAVNKLSKITTNDPSLPVIKTNLNEAASYLDQSWLALMNMNYESSIQYSQTSQTISADALKELSDLDRSISGLATMLESPLTYALVEAITLSVVTVIAWSRLKTFYVKKTLKSKIEVNDDES